MIGDTQGGELMDGNRRLECMMGSAEHAAMAIGIRQAAAMEVSQAWDLIGIRATATHLVANGNRKAAGIVEEMKGEPWGHPLKGCRSRAKTVSNHGVGGY